MFKKFRFFIFCLLPGLLTACGQQGQDTVAGIDPAALRYYQSLAAPGDWLVINYWAEWCPPCIEEIPELNRVHQQAGFSVFAVDDHLSDKQVLDARAKKAGIDYIVLDHDPSESLGYERPGVLPATVLIHPESAVTRYLFGAQTKASILQTIRALQESAPSETN
ncbi:MAG: thioredoxin [Proteobacteria bacterium]|nr:MAG: thioredoxin [Pseudomonadota bacterium]